ncbi:hypothetical protein HMI49_04845 [Corallococcus exercitus]|uniref:Lipoprotein n=1 Tax=Corallococcus exercitus TaxID=2316736 RepID=A0A7Y4KET7_9BACT|nr:hypothetical protein [Corallococcus exercitus]NOK32523.1 hypothetical protein [Corallococcus exercitus]
MSATKFAAFAAALISLLVSGCAHRGPVPLKPDACTPQPCRAQVAPYTTTYFQARFMSKAIGYHFGLIGGLVAAGLTDYDKKHTPERQQENEFEHRIGDFDTAQYFLGEFEKRVGESRRIALHLNKDPAALAPVVTFMHAEDEDVTKAVAEIPNLQAGDDVGTFRLVYGLAMREGIEQFGFSKTYRAFLRVNGVVKNRNGEIIWRDSVFVFGDKPYVGSEADAENIDPAGLIAEFKALTPKVIDLMMITLNGGTLPDMGTIVDSDDTDAAY